MNSKSGEGHSAEPHLRPRPRGQRDGEDRGHERPQRRVQLDHLPTEGRGQAECI